MSNSSSSNDVGCMTVIFLILLILKLFGVISISWWWVFAPVLLEVAILIFVVIVYLIIKS